MLLSVLSGVIVAGKSMTAFQGPNRIHPGSLSTKLASFCFISQSVITLGYPTVGTTYELDYTKINVKFEFAFWRYILNLLQSIFLYFQVMKFCCGIKLIIFV